jgi:hypothetical protein
VFYTIAIIYSLSKLMKLKYSSMLHRWR